MFLFFPFVAMLSDLPPTAFAESDPAPVVCCAAAAQPGSALMVTARRPDTLASRPTIAGFDSPVPLELWRNDDGLFYVDGTINGHQVRFVVDTGASMIVLTADDARRANVAAGSDSPVVHAETVGGRAALSRVTLASMQVGATGGNRVPAAVAREGLSVSLLGQSWLSHLASVTIEGDRMTLR